jgi:hypothetical protein
VELGSFALVLIVIALVQLFASRTFDLFGHALWLDEILTWLIANDGSLVHAMRGVHGGVETNPPTLYLLLWPIAKVAGGLNEVGLRVFSLASMLIAIIGGYALCRRVFGALASAAGALALWAHPLVVDQAFEARFYGPWLAATIWLCALSIDPGQTVSRASTALRYILAVLVATLHWFGLVVLALLIAAEWFLSVRYDRQSPPERVGRIAPLLVGVAASLACLPFMLGQRDGLSVPTWIEPITLPDVKKMMVRLFGPPALITVVMTWWVARVMSRRLNGAPDIRALLPITSLLLLPPIVIAFSLLVQPAMKDRYLIVSLPVLAPLAAWLAHELNRWWTSGLIVALVVVGAAEMKGKAASARGLERQLSDIAAAIDANDDVQPVVFKRRIDLYPMLRLRPDIVARSKVLSFDDPAPPVLSHATVYERDMGRKVSRFYPIAEPISEPELRTLDSFIAVFPPYEVAEMQELLPGCRVRRVADQVYVVAPVKP